MNLLLLHLFARDAAESIVGASLGTAQWYPPILSMPLRRKGVPGHLVIILGPPDPFCFVHNTDPLDGVRASRRFEHLKGLVVAGLAQVDGDRILRIDAGPDDEGRSFALFLHLYGARGRAILKRDGDAIETVGGRDREPEKPERARPIGFDRASVFAVREAIQGEQPAQAIVPGLDRQLLEAFTNGGRPVDIEALVAFRDGIVNGSMAYDLVARQSPGTAAPVPHVETPAENRLGPFDDAFAACTAAGKAVLARANRDIIERQARPIRARMAALKKLTAHLENDLSRAQDHGRIRREAEILAAYQTRIRTGADQAELPDIYDPDTIVTIVLDPAEPISVQIEKRFKKATKLEKSRAHAKRRLVMVARERAEIDSALSSLEASRGLADSLANIEGMRSRFDVRAVQPSTGKDRKKAEPERTLRTFELSADWYALVGRNNHENDELTFHVARPGDWWLHAQSVPGSHVILKARNASGNPPRTILERAAAIAAHFSKARHSSLVPVIYTQRKYVRKFRGAKPGQVRCEREKTLTVAPALPDGR